MLLLDLSDSGNAGASSVPGDLVSVQIAPLGFSFETLAANERMNTIMNHELVHVATMDQAAGADRMFRRLFGGKVMPINEQPESILYFYLTSPRVAAPRWFHEGIAVFVDTWMAGGLGRVQSGYDEMVFRAMVRDNAPFYNPLGLVSKGTDVDFQLEINSYLYGARFMTWLARRYSPEQLIEWTARTRGQPRLLRDAVQARVQDRPRGGVGAVDRRRADVSAREPRGDSQVSGHAVSRRHQPRAGLGVARLFTIRHRRRSTPPSTTPVSSRTSAPSTSRAARCSASCRSKVR